MKKLVLKKDVVARINSDQMNQLKGGAGNTVLACQNTNYATCADTCNKDTCAETCACTTGPQNPTCMQSCNQAPSCPGYNTCNATCGNDSSCIAWCPTSVACY